MEISCRTNTVITSQWPEVSHWAKVSHWVKVSLGANVSPVCWMGVGTGAVVYSMITISRIDRWFVWNGICDCVASLVVWHHPFSSLLVFYSYCWLSRIVVLSWAALSHGFGFPKGRGPCQEHGLVKWMSPILCARQAAICCFPKLQLVVWFVSEVPLMARLKFCCPCYTC